MLIDKSGNEAIDKVREEMRHAINATHLIKLRQLVAENEANEELKQEVNYCKQRIEIIEL
jgi:hypothetical protein